ARVEQGVDALARQQLSAFRVFRPGLLAAAVGRARQPAVELGHQFAVEGDVVEEVLRAGIELRGQRGHGASGAGGKTPRIPPAPRAAAAGAASRRRWPATPPCPAPWPASTRPPRPSTSST